MTYKYYQGMARIPENVAYDTTYIIDQIRKAGYIVLDSSITATVDDYETVVQVCSKEIESGTYGASKCSVQYRKVHGDKAGRFYGLPKAKRTRPAMIDMMAGLTA